MVIFARKDFKFIDVLQSDDPQLRTGFAFTAKFFGRFLAGSEESPAHILHLRPLIIGSVSSHQAGTFYPESPGAYSKSARCEVLASDENSGYKVFQCENIDNAVQVLQYCYPKVQEIKESVNIGYSNGQKVVDTEKKLEKSFETNLGTQHLYSIKGKDGKDYPVEYFEKLYDKYVWPTAKTFDKKTRGHYFTYFREIEAKRGTTHKGFEETRFRHISEKIYLELYFAKMTNYLKRLFSIVTGE